MDPHFRSLRWVVFHRRDLVLRTVAAGTMTLLVAWVATRI
jgi:hypothetical protein